MHISTEKASIQELLAQKGVPPSLQEVYYSLHQELEATQKRNEILEDELKKLQNTQYEINAQKEYLEAVVSELETQQAALEIHKREAITKNELLEQTVGKLEAKQSEVEMQQTYMLDVIDQLEASQKEISQKNEILEHTVGRLESKKSEVEMQQTYMLDVIDQLEASQKEISQKNEILEYTSEILKRAYGNITDSINYAKRIQDALLPELGLLNNWFQDHFVLFRPTDVVSGDFYWFTQVKHKVIVVAADCTGHGIPGAFMSILAIESLHYIVNVQEIDDADQIVNQLHENTRLLLRQHETQNMDGMDIALVILDRKHKILEYAGAHNPLILIKDGKVLHIKADRYAVGGHQKEPTREFTKHIFHVKEGDSFYIYSDGYQDMCGGKDSRRFMSQRFRRVLSEISPKSMHMQKKILGKIMKFWLRNEPKHLDDILVMGVRI